MRVKFQEMEVDSIEQPDNKVSEDGPEAMAKTDYRKSESADSTAETIDCAQQRARLFDEIVWGGISADLAKCRGLNPDIFFPVRGASVREAKAVCAECSIRLACFEYAMINHEDHGVWGGTSERQRRDLRPKYRRLGKDQPISKIAPQPERNPVLFQRAMEQRTLSPRTLAIPIAETLVESPKITSPPKSIQTKLIAYLAPFGHIGIRVQSEDDIFALIAEHINTRVSQLQETVIHLRKYDLVRCVFTTDGSCVIGIALTTTAINRYGLMTTSSDLQTRAV